MKNLKKMLTAVLSAALLISALSVPASAAEAETSTTTAFADVDQNAWYAEAVNALTEGGLIKGGPDGLFHPDDPVTFAELYTMISRLYNTDEEYYGDEWDAMWDGYTRDIITDPCAYGDRVFSIVNDGEWYHWAAHAWLHVFDREKAKEIDGGHVCSPENIDLPVPRTEVITTIYWLTAALSDECSDYYHDMTPIHDYKPEDIPDWDAVCGTARIDTPDMVKANYVRRFNDDPLAVHYLDGELNFSYADRLKWVGSNDGTPCRLAYENEWMGTLSYPDLETIRKHCNPELRPYIDAKPKLVLAAYNLGITEGVDANHTCNPTANVTRAELCTMLYRMGMTRRFWPAWQNDAWLESIGCSDRPISK